MGKEGMIYEFNSFHKDNELMLRQACICDGHIRLFTARIYIQNKPQSKKLPTGKLKVAPAFGERSHSVQYVALGFHSS